MKQFEKVPIKVPAKNVFNLDHDVKASYNFDKLYPFLCHPIYPGDTFNCRAEVFMRTMPLLSPLMHNVDMRLYFFFVPDRLLWNEDRKSNWKTFITGGEDGRYGMFGPESDPRENPVLPHFRYVHAANVIDLTPGSLMDHLGFPTLPSRFEDLNPVAEQRVCSLPLRAYQLIYNEYFRNQNVQNEIEFSYGEGEETDNNLRTLATFRYKNLEKDYFTSCLPFQQRGEAVSLPISYDSDSSDVVNLDVVTNSARALGGTGRGQAIAIDGTNTVFVNSAAIPEGPIEMLGTTSLNAADLSFTGLSIGTINDFRYCLRLQQWLENNARCGSRYIEQLLAHFGVTSSDARLQRPELLGGGVIPLIFSDVEQMSYGDGSNGDVLGNLAGKGTLYGKTNGFKKYFEEHGILMGILTIIPRTSYQQGLPRYWTQFDKTDWYFPEFANLGEQAVLNKEVYYNPVAVPPGMAQDDPDGVFGYQGRFTELRYIPSTIHGEMREGLNYWHLGRIFPFEPGLNSDFVESHTRANVFAMEDVANSGYDPFICQIRLDIKAVRPLPKYAIPTL